jgi:hypothetical protein
MPKPPRRYIIGLPDWELPRLDDRAYDLVNEVAAKSTVRYFDREALGDKFYELFLERVCELAQLGANEAIEYWLKGLADGNNGRFPAMCVELPFLEREEQVDPLAIAYCVDNEDGSRTELLRVPLAEVLDRAFEENESSSGLSVRRRAVAASLRKLAKSLELGSGQGAPLADVVRLSRRTPTP